MRNQRTSVVFTPKGYCRSVLWFRMWSQKSQNWSQKKTHLWPTTCHFLGPTRWSFSWQCSAQSRRWSSVCTLQYRFPCTDKVFLVPQSSISLNKSFPKCSPPAVKCNAIAKAFPSWYTLGDCSMFFTCKWRFTAGAQAALVRRMQSLLSVIQIWQLRCALDCVSDYVACCWHVLFAVSGCGTDTACGFAHWIMAHPVWPFPPYGSCPSFRLTPRSFGIQASVLIHDLCVWLWCLLAWMSGIDLNLRKISWNMKKLRKWLCTSACRSEIRIREWCTDLLHRRGEHSTSPHVGSFTCFFHMHSSKLLN